MSQPVQPVTQKGAPLVWDWVVYPSLAYPVLWSLYCYCLCVCLRVHHEYMLFVCVHVIIYMAEWSDGILRVFERIDIINGM